jgi:hypothetical protein
MAQGNIRRFLFGLFRQFLGLLSDIEPLADSGSQFGTEQGADHGSDHLHTIKASLTLKQQGRDQVENYDPEQQAKPAAHLLSSGSCFDRHLMTPVQEDMQGDAPLADTSGKITKPSLFGTAIFWSKLQSSSPCILPPSIGDGSCEIRELKKASWHKED